MARIDFLINARMVILETDYVRATKVADNIVHVEGHMGVQITKEKARYTNGVIEKVMPLKYGMIIDRHEDYSIDPVEVYEVLNALPFLKAIAIVAYRNLTHTTESAEKSLFKGPLRVFGSVERAHQWLAEILSTP